MRVLQVNYKMDIGGIESFLMNICRNIKEKDINFMFLTYNDYKFDYEEELLKMNYKIIKISNPNNVSVFKHINEIYNVIKEEKIDVVHCHTYFNSAYVMIAAKLAKVKVRIVHSHTTYGLKKDIFLKRIKWCISRTLINNLSTKRIACSTEAGKSLFGNKSFEIIENGINVKDFHYDNKVRKIYRQQFKLKEDEFVIGHIGRFDYPKNHTFLLEIFEKILTIKENSKLILVGSGSLQNKKKKIAVKKNLESKVIFLGNRRDVNKILNTFDVFIFPSLYEGLPLTLVEVQANRLPILVSNNVSKEIKLTEYIQFLSLEDGASKWAEKAISLNKKRNSSKSVLEDSKYNIDNVISKLVKIYRGV